MVKLSSNKFNVRYLERRSEKGQKRVSGDIWNRVWRRYVHMEKCYILKDVAVKFPLTTPPIDLIEVILLCMSIDSLFILISS
jgi:hypothetical protein